MSFLLKRESAHEGINVENVEISPEEEKTPGEELGDLLREISPTGEVRAVLDPEFIKTNIFGDSDLSRFIISEVPGNKIFTQHILSLNLPPKVLAVNVGAGWGQESRALISSAERVGKKIAVVDLEIEPTISDFDNREGKQLLSEELRSRQMCVVGDLRTTPFPEDKIDLIFSSGVLRYLISQRPVNKETIEAELKDSMSVVKPGGHIVHMELGAAGSRFTYGEGSGGYKDVLEVFGYNSSTRDALAPGHYSIKEVTLENVYKFTNWYLLMAVTQNPDYIELPESTLPEQQDKIEALVRKITDGLKNKFPKDKDAPDYTDRKKAYYRELLSMAGQEDKVALIITARKHTPSDPY